jgi:uncharacterized circularly permuted ATP-grasp superfamily protein/uncharacterized alpha-E superfamily protein
MPPTVMSTDSNLTKPLGNYNPIPGSYDELLDARGIPREKYKFILNSYEEIGGAEMLQRRKDLTRLLKDNGVTYNVYGSGPEKQRLWSLDLMPFLMESTEFSAIERGLIQRGELLNALFKDLYGKRRLLFDRIVPPEIVFGAPGYLRSCFGSYQNRERELCFFSSDLARRADGTFVVIGDRAQAPSGTGYALENRIALSKVFPSLYRDSEVHRVAIFFRTLRKTLTQLVRRSNNSEPVIVLLTPGPGNETYFEHVFLAGYLGYTLAQATDLTVRNNRVFLKTVEGHQQVDVVLRRTDDLYMDPLELKDDSLLGVPGISEAVRNGNVIVVNPLGSAVLENRSLMAYFPALCRYYFGEELILPNTETYYLGDPSHFNAVMANLGRYVIKPTVRSSGSEHQYPSRLSQADLDSLVSRLRQSPQNFIAQEIVPGSSIAIMDSNNQMVAAKCVIRTFQVASESGYQVMPGGLARVSTRTDELVVTNQSGAGSKDIWILASEPQKDVTLLRIDQSEGRISRKATGGVPSRVADNIFWMARYGERAENNARLIRNAINKMTQIEDYWGGEDIAKLLKMLTHVSGEYPGFVGDDGNDLINRPETELQKLIYDQATHGSVHYNISAMIKASQNLRDNLSDDLRSVIAQLEGAPYASIVSSVQNAHLADIIIYLSAIAGLSHENMSREVGWSFLELGRRIERATFSIRVLRSFLLLGNLYDTFVVENLLHINDIRITYMRRYQHRIDTGSVLDILIFDETNPRSLGYQLAKILEFVSKLPVQSDAAPPAAEKIALRLYTAYRTSDIRQILADENPQEKFGQWLDSLGTLTNELSQSLAETYFTYVEEQFSIGDLNG